MSNVNLKELFAGMQTQMSANLTTNREVLLHSGTKGDALENVWIEWLRKYLPNRYCVDKAMVIDSKGNLSHQLDLVIYDQQYTPFVFNQNGAKYIPVEGVYAVFEVKPELNKGYISYAGDKIESVRRLYRASASIIDVGIKKDPRPLTQILGGILASESAIQKNAVVEKHLRSLTGLKGIDIGCAVDYACFYIDYDKNYDPDQKSKTNVKRNQEIIDYYNERKPKNVYFSESNNSMVAFFLQLMRYLQQSIGTVGAIDLGEYSKAIGFTIDKDL